MLLNYAQKAYQCNHNTIVQHARHFNLVADPEGVSDLDIWDIFMRALVLNKCVLSMLQLGGGGSGGMPTHEKLV